MLSHIFRTHRKLCIGLITAFALVLLLLYFYAALQSGIWHQNTFLYRQSDGSFSGKNSYSEYKMNIAQRSSGADVVFRVNDMVRKYLIFSDSYGHEVQIFEDGTCVFHGSAVMSGDSTLLLSDDDKIADFTVSMSTTDDFFTVPSDEEQFPSYTSLYNHAIRQITDRRGNLLMVFFAVLLAVLLVIDIRYPDFFFRLRYGLHVDGGSPSDLYRVGQQIEKILSPIAIIGFLIATFVVH